MNYQHIFHAGNFADVFKHCILLALVKNFFKKHTPITYFETHAGSGCYALQSKPAQKTQEYRQGIGKLFDVIDPPEIVKNYLQIIVELNATDSIIPEIKYYPGSPYLIEKILRPTDKMILCELHDAEYQALKSLFYSNPKIAIHHHDGYTALKALLPPIPRRGIVFIDSPFEKEDELTPLKMGLQWAFKKWPHGIYAIWYPIKNTQQHVSLLKNLRALGVEMLNAKMIINPDPTSTKLIGTGMAILVDPEKHLIC